MEKEKSLIRSHTIPIQHDKTLQRALILRGHEHLQTYRAGEYRLTMAVSALDSKNYPKAISEFKEALRINPEYAEAHYYLGIMYFLIGRHQDAAEAYKGTINIDSTHYMAHLNLGIVSHLLGQYDDAITAYKKTIQLAPNLAEAHSRLGSVYAIKGMRAEAVNAYKEALRIKLESLINETE